MIYEDVEGRLLVLDLYIDDKIYRIIGIYAPNQDKPDFFSVVLKFIQNCGTRIIVIGDFNLTLDINLDRLNTYNNNNRSKVVVENFMQEHDLDDVWHIRNPNKKTIYLDKKMYVIRKLRQVEIDYALTSKDVDVENITFCPAMFTDHTAIHLAIKSDNNQEKRGPSYWKFNNLLLKSEEFIRFMNGCFDQRYKL